MFIARLLTHLLVVSAGFLLSIQTAGAIPVLTSTNIIQNTLTAIPNCLHYKVIGVCYWKQCASGACWVSSTPKLDHYLPDAVVSVYRKENSNPWDYANTVVDPTAQAMGEKQIKSTLGVSMGFGNESASLPEEQNTHFKEADLIGNPAITFFTQHSDVFLKSQATPLVPYYSSLSDAYAWRSPLLEMARYPLNIVPGVHIVGTLLDNWGSVYPRTGFIDQPADAKAAAVIAQRAADIATRGLQPHLYQSLNSDNSCGDHCQTWPAIENDSNTQWQMVYPESHSMCLVFGENDLNALTPWEQSAANAGNGNYVWVMWRHYHGCVSGQGTYIGSTDFS